jgi:uncharacterized protein YqgV (UPF0045/DUF77 family)
MSNTSAQVSLYPLGPNHLRPAIRNALAVFHRYDLVVRPGDMSTVINGDDIEVFEALREVFRDAAALGPVVMTTTFSNACPVGRASVEESPDQGS